MGRKIPLAGRKIKCNGCGHTTVTGAGRVMRKIVFFFCPKCWKDRRGCELQMDAASRRVAP
jgi:hypothetical protein